MQVIHPRALEGDVPRIAVDVNGDHVTLDAEGQFEIPDDARGWVANFASAHGVAVEDIVIEADDDEYDEMTFDELYALAQEHDIPGRSSMDSDELADALRAED